MNYLLFDDEARFTLYPFALTRPVADIRIGVRTIREKWEDYLGETTGSFTESFLRRKYDCRIEMVNVLINGSVFPDQEILKEILQLETGYKLVKNNKLIALKMDAGALTECIERAERSVRSDFSNVLKTWGGGNVTALHTIDFIQYPWDIFSKNADAIERDIRRLTAGRTSEKISPTNRVTGSRIFIEKGARVEHCILNSETGPIYIGKDAEIMEGCMIRGPFAMCDHSVVKMGAKIYGPTTIGPYCKVGGEISNSVLIGYSNKGHDGFIGNSVIGEWCNLGADTNCSNLKNNYGPVNVWSELQNAYVDTGLQFCGLMMGDHSKCGINTMFNTGTVVGVNCNVYGGNFPPKHIPSFTWGGDHNWQEFHADKAVEVARRMMERRGIKFTQEDKAIFDAVLDITSENRRKFLQ